MQPFTAILELRSSVPGTNGCGVALEKLVILRMLQSMFSFKLICLVNFFLAPHAISESGNSPWGIRGAESLSTTALGIVRYVESTEGSSGEVRSNATRLTCILKRLQGAKRYRITGVACDENGACSEPRYTKGVTIFGLLWFSFLWLLSRFCIFFSNRSSRLYSGGCDLNKHDLCNITICGEPST